MPTIRLTQNAVDKMPAPATGRMILWDRMTPGFGLRVTSKGAKTWVASYRLTDGRKVMETLGPLHRLPKLDDARKAARDSMLKAAAGGSNPVKERKRAAEAASVSTFRAVATRYIERYAMKHTKGSTWKEAKRQLDVDVFPKWGDRPVASITRQDVASLLEAIEGRGAPLQANRTLARLKTLFAWAMRQEIISYDPTRAVDKVVREIARDRVLSDREIVLFWNACEAIGWPWGPLGKLLLLTAQRRDEVAGATWGELDLQQRKWTIPRERAKNDRAHEVYLNDLALEVIDSLPRLGADPFFLFTTTGTTHVSGYSKARAAIDRHMATEAGEPIPYWTFHDLRRSAATGMARMNIPPHVADRLLNHVSGTIRGVAAVYNRFSYEPERRAALEAWGRYIEGLLGAQAQNVVPLRRQAEV